MTLRKRKGDFMVPLLAKMAVERKCDFEHVILLGNYELSYALGRISKEFGISRRDSMESVGALREEILESIGNRTTEDERMARLLRVLKEMDKYTDDYDDQMYELYVMGFE